MPSNEVLAAAAFFLASVFAALWGYLRKPPPTPGAPNPVIASIGAELGSRQQIDELIRAVERIGDILENKQQAGIEAKLNHLTEMVDDALSKRRD